MATNRRLLPYKDLDTYYPAPATGGVGSAGWFRQAAHNYSMMMNAAKISGGELTGTVTFDPQWQGVTLSDLAVSQGGYVRVGSIVYLWAHAYISDLDATTGAGLTDLPVAPADTVLPFHAGYGYVYDAITSYLPFAAEISADTLQFYYAWGTAVDGRVLDADPISISSNAGEIGVYATYRCAQPADGYLTEQTYLIEAQEAI